MLEKLIGQQTWLSIQSIMSFICHCQSATIFVHIKVLCSGNSQAHFVATLYIVLIGLYLQVKEKINLYNMV